MMSGDCPGSVHTREVLPMSNESYDRPPPRGAADQQRRREATYDARVDAWIARREAELKAGGKRRRRRRRR
jgi:hypothetical protein